MKRSEKDKMLAGDLYTANSPELAPDNARASEWINRYNASLTASSEEHHAMLTELFASVGKGAVIRPPFYCD